MRDHREHPLGPVPHVDVAVASLGEACRTAEVVAQHVDGLGAAHQVGPEVPVDGTDHVTGSERHGRTDWDGLLPAARDEPAAKAATRVHGAKPILDRAGQHHPSVRRLEIAGRRPRRSSTPHHLLDRGSRSAPRTGRRHPRAASRRGSVCREPSPGGSVRRGRRTRRRQTRAAISAPIPPEPVSSWTISRRPVCRTDSRIGSVSNGCTVRRSMTSASMPLRRGDLGCREAARHEAAVGHQGDIPPGRRTAHRPSGSAGARRTTSARIERYSALCSKYRTGLGSRTAARRRS